MNLWKLVSVAKLFLLLVCCLPQEITAGSIATDLLMLHFLKKILKPKFVPLPIPLPLPIKFTKHSHKAYPVPLHNHLYSGHHGGASPLSFHLGGGYDYLSAGHGMPAFGHHSSGYGGYGGYSGYGGHGLSALSHLGTGHGLSALSHLGTGHGLSALSHLETGHGLSALSHLETGHGLSALSHLETGHGLSALSHLETGHELSALSHIPTILEAPPKIPESVLKYLAKLDEAEKLKSAHPISESDLKLLTTSSDHSSVLGHTYSNKVDSVDDDIHAIGGFDLLDDLDVLGGKDEGWK